jgi:CRISPR-associated endonuclease/helicase Cas3
MHAPLLPVFSKLADPAAVPPAIANLLPQGWQLSQHQLETYNALVNNPDVDVVINTAMTGDGKSLAGQLPLLVDKHETLALYPTNELIRDQEGSATRTLSIWNRPERWVKMLNSIMLDQKTEELEHTGRGGAIDQIFMHSKLVLSNPDIFHIIMQFFYQQPGRAPDWLAGRVGSMFRQLTFDEFHIFDLPQVVSVMTALLFLHEQAPGRLKTLFLSATPGGELLTILSKAGLRHHLVETGSTYYHGEQTGVEWRRILHGCDLHFDTLRAEAWVQAHLDDVLLPFFRQHRPGAKGAIIVNSVAAAHRIVAWLKPRLAQEGITVLSNTGLTDRETRRISYDADLLVATSTVDVGVDFQINFLVFEASNTGTFLQRLGRLGRHSSYTRDGTTHQFDAFSAYALVPEFVAERLFKGYKSDPALLTDGETIPRQNLQDALHTAYPEPTTFPLYVKRWGRYQPAYVLSVLGKPLIHDAYAGLWEPLKERYEKTFDIKLSKAWGMVKRLRGEGKELVLDEARSFRGGSPLVGAVLVPRELSDTSSDTSPDKSDTSPDKKDKLYAKTYDLFWLLANAELDMLEDGEKEFFATVGTDASSYPSIRRAKPVAYFRLRHYRNERNDVVVKLPPDISDWGSEMHHQVQVMSGIKVEAPGIPYLNNLNGNLARRKIVGLLIPGAHPLEVQRKLQLPMLFPLYRYADVYGAEGCIAFARQALILDTALRRCNPWKHIEVASIIL